MLLHFHVLQEIVTSKRRLIIPGLNQSLKLYNFLKLSENNIDVVEFPCNGEDEDLYLNYKLNQYGSFLDNYKENIYDDIFCHSLGSLVFLLNTQKLNFKRAFLLAPALKTWKPLEVLFKNLSPRIKTPSLNLPSRRAFSFCSISLYKQVIDLQKDVEILCQSNTYKDLNISIVHDPRDELVRNCDNFKYFNVFEYYSVDFPRHLCLDFIERIVAEDKTVEIFS